MPLERLQKILARAGVASRRSAEELILGGRVRVNGKVVRELGTRADPRRDKVEVDARRIQAEDLVYIVLHKPRGYVSTVDDPEGRPTVLDLVSDVPARLYPVGRLDFSTSGVLLLTNDGALTQGLLHPQKQVPKIYVVKLDGLIDDDEIERWRGGIFIAGADGEPGMRTRPAEVQRLRDEDGKSWLRVTLAEGKNQQIRRMAAASGFTVMRLARVSFGGIDHEDLRPGEWRPLSVDELRRLKKTYGVPSRVRPQAALFELWVKGREKAKRRPRPQARGGDGEAPPRRGDTRASRGSSGQKSTRPAQGHRSASSRPTTESPRGRKSPQGPQSPSPRSKTPRRRPRG
jgi:23S rRNA pseudouridine2605 synthase